MNGILADTLTELKDRKIVYVFAFATVLALLVIFAGDKAGDEFSVSMGDLEGRGVSEGFLASAIANE